MSISYQYCNDSSHLNAVKLRQDIYTPHVQYDATELYSGVSVCSIHAGKHIPHPRRIHQICTAVIQRLLHRMSLLVDTAQPRLLTMVVFFRMHVVREEYI